MITHFRISVIRFTTKTALDLNIHNLQIIYLNYFHLPKNFLNVFFPSYLFASNCKHLPSKFLKHLTNHTLYKQRHKPYWSSIDTVIQLLKNQKPNHRRVYPQAKLPRFFKNIPHTHKSTPSSHLGRAKICSEIQEVERGVKGIKNILRAAPN